MFYRHCASVKEDKYDDQPEPPLLLAHFTYDNPGTSHWRPELTGSTWSWKKIAVKRFECPHILCYTYPPFLLLQFSASFCLQQLFFGLKKGTCFLSSSFSMLVLLHSIFSRRYFPFRSHFAHLPSMILRLSFSLVRSSAKIRSSKKVRKKKELRSERISIAVSRSS